MLATAIIVFREVLEAGLIVGIVLAATQGVHSRGLFVAGGVSAGVLGAIVLAVFAGSISSALEGIGQEVFNAAVLAIAAVMLALHNIWMARHGRELATNLKAAGQAVIDGSKTLWALAAVVAIAVLREGAEVVLFLYGIAVSSGAGSVSLLTGGAAGLAAGAAMTALTYFGLLKIPPRHLFGVTSLLLCFVAAGMAAQCVSFLEKADLSTIGTATAWDSSGLISSGSIAGRVLHALLGYDDKPSIMQVAVYGIALSAVLTASRLTRPRTAAALKERSASKSSQQQVAA